MWKVSGTISEQSSQTKKFDYGIGLSKFQFHKLQHQAIQNTGSSLNLEMLSYTNDLPHFILTCRDTTLIHVQSHENSGGDEQVPVVW